MNNKFDHGGKVFVVARKLGVAPEEIIDFSASINPLGPPAGVRKAVAVAFDRLVHYPDDDCTELVGALSRHHGCDTANICVANGSTELIYLLPRLVAGSRALLVAPTFSEYGHSLHQAGWHYDHLFLPAQTGFSLSFPAVQRELEKGYDLLFLCNPGNPTGRLYPPEEVADLLSLCRAAGTLLVVDEAFMDFCEEGSAKRALLAGGGVVLRSMTKFFGFPGLRLGYALAEESLAARFAALRPPWSVNTLAQAAGLGALADRNHALDTIAVVTAERFFLVAELAKLPGVRVFPGAANYLLVELTNGSSAALLQDKLLPKRLLIRDCAAFAGLGEQFFRVAVRSRGENYILLAALGEVLG